MARDPDRHRPAREPLRQEHEQRPDPSGHGLDERAEPPRRPPAQAGERDQPRGHGGAERQADLIRELQGRQGHRRVTEEGAARHQGREPPQLAGLRVPEQGREDRLHPGHDRPEPERSDRGAGADDHRPRVAGRRRQLPGRQRGLPGQRGVEAGRGVERAGRNHRRDHHPDLHVRHADRDVAADPHRPRRRRHRPRADRPARPRHLGADRGPDARDDARARRGHRLRVIHRQPPQGLHGAGLRHRRGGRALGGHRRRRGRLRGRDRRDRPRLAGRCPDPTRQRPGLFGGGRGPDRDPHRDHADPRPAGDHGQAHRLPAGSLPEAAPARSPPPWLGSLGPLHREPSDPGDADRGRDPPRAGDPGAQSAAGPAEQRADAQVHHRPPGIRPHRQGLRTRHQRPAPDRRRLRQGQGPQRPEEAQPAQVPAAAAGAAGGRSRPRSSSRRRGCRRTRPQSEAEQQVSSQPPTKKEKQADQQEAVPEDDGERSASGPPPEPDRQDEGRQGRIAGGRRQVRQRRVIQRDPDHGAVRGRHDRPRESPARQP